MAAILRKAWVLPYRPALGYRIPLTFMSDSAGSGRRVLSEEELAGENIYVHKMEKEKLEKLKHVKEEGHSKEEESHSKPTESHDAPSSVKKEGSEAHK